MSISWFNSLMYSYQIHAQGQQKVKVQNKFKLTIKIILWCLLKFSIHFFLHATASIDFGHVIACWVII